MEASAAEGHLPVPNAIVSRHHGLLGTVIELHVWSEDPVLVATVESAVIAEIDRLQDVFNVHDDRSDLCRWLAGDAEPSPDLATVVALAATWQARSAGAFDPAVGALVELWADAARHGRAASDPEIGRVLAAMRDPDDPRSRPSDLNALAKGWIVDRSFERAWEVGEGTGLTINAGGDLLHHGPRPLVVGIEDPAQPYDNVVPLLRVRLAEGALATSGGARRGWQIGERWYSHVIDPRSGRPVDHVASASVLAPDAATADAIATVLTVSSIDEGLAFVTGLDAVGCCIVARDGTVHRDRRWLEHELDT